MKNKLCFFIFITIGDLYILIKMKKVQLGNVYSLTTDKGVALFQLVNLPEDKRNDVEMIKVSYTLFDKLPPLSNAIFEDGFFYIRFPAKTALRRKIINLIGYISLPDCFEIPLYERAGHYFKKNYWIISNRKDNSFIEVKDLDEEHVKLSPSGVWNDTYLKERLEEGWRLENWK